MDSNKNMLDAWVEAQTKSVNNLVETSKKMQESFQKGNLMEETTDIYRNWLNGQKSIVEETMNPKTAESKGNGTSEPVQGGNDMFATWMNAQTQFANAWMEGLKKMIPAAQPSATSPMDMFNQATKLYQQWNNLFANTLSQTTGQAGNFHNMFGNANAMNNSFSQLLNSNAVFTKMFELYQQGMEQFQKNISEAQNNGKQFADLAQVFSPEKFQEVMNTVFQFAPAEQFKQLYEQMNTVAQQFSTQQHDLQQQWVEQVKQMGNVFQDGVSTLTNSTMSNPALKQMEQAFAPLTRLMPAGKEKQTFDAFMQLKDKFAQYWTKYNDMQYIVYNTGRKALEHVLQDSLNKAKENKGQAPDYKEFYNQWMNTTENLMIETFGTDEFSKVQGELLTIGSEIKRIIEKQMERTLEGLPLVSRSDADEMAQTIHDLKARVRTLEKQLRDQNKSEAPVAEAADKGKAKVNGKK